MRFAARTFGRTAARADGFGHTQCHGNQRARAARARKFPRLRALQASGGLRLLLGIVPPQRDGDRAERCEVGAIEAALDDFALMLHARARSCSKLEQFTIVSIL
jgi:hypothetical protein